MPPAVWERRKTANSGTLINTGNFFMEKDENWVMVYSSGQQHLVELAKQMLADNNIESVIVNQQDSLFHHTHGNVELHVLKRDEKKALMLIKEFSS